MHLAKEIINQLFNDQCAWIVKNTANFTDQNIPECLSKRKESIIWGTFIW